MPSLWRPTRPHQNAMLLDRLAVAERPWSFHRRVGCVSNASPHREGRFVRSDGGLGLSP